MLEEKLTNCFKGVRNKILCSLLYKPRTVKELTIELYPQNRGTPNGTLVVCKCGNRRFFPRERFSSISDNVRCKDCRKRVKKSKHQVKEKIHMFAYHPIDPRKDKDNYTNLKYKHIKKLEESNLVIYENNTYKLNYSSLFQIIENMFIINSIFTANEIKDRKYPETLTRLLREFGIQVLSIRKIKGFEGVEPVASMDFGKLLELFSQSIAYTDNKQLKHYIKKCSRIDLLKVKDINMLMDFFNFCKMAHFTYKGNTLTRWLMRAMNS